MTSNIDIGPPTTLEVTEVFWSTGAFVNVPIRDDKS